MRSVPAFSTRRQRPPNWHGFTLVELLVTISIAAILAAIAVPAMQQFLAARAVDAQAQELANSLRLARSEALKRGMEVSVCAASTANAATCSGDALWVNGWVVFYDNAPFGTVDANDGVIHVQSSGGKGVGGVTKAPAFLTFRRNGILMAGAIPGSVQMELQPNLGTTSSGYASAVRTVCINVQGRVSVGKGSLAQCP